MRRAFSIAVVALQLLSACGSEANGPGPGGDAGPTLDAGQLGPVNVVLAVDVASQRRAISPLIYGINDGSTPSRDRPTVVRVGGNRLTAYNWENNASNAGSDYCHQNDGTFGGPGSTPGSAFLATLMDARARGTAAIVTVPVVDYVAADHDDLGDGGLGPPQCIGDVMNSGANFLTTRFIGNHPRKGSAFSLTPNLNDGAVYQDELLAYLLNGYSDVPIYVSLDNEPDLWSSTHARIHPVPVTYTELVQRNIDFADALKDVSATTKTLGFVSFGYSGYMNLQNASDRAGKGDFIPYYLDQMKAAETSTGHRLIDYLDLHWYSEALGNGVRVTNPNDGTAASARVQAPRSLWDTSYPEDSWIVNDVLHAPIALLPWLKQTIATHYAGTGLAITEWNYGGGNHVSGAIATADALGVFGREGVDLATIWLLHGNEPYTLAGLRVFTNFDGSGGAFAATSVEATTSDVDRVTVYASQAADGHVVVVIVNKATVALTAGLTLAGAPTVTAARRYLLDGDAATITSEAELAATASNAFRVPLPASSVTVLVPH